MRGGGGRAGEVQKKYSRKGKLNEKNSCTPINPKKYSCYGLKKIHTRNLITKKNSCSSKIPLPPITFLMVRPLPRLAVHNRGERCVTSLKTAAKETILIPNIAHNTAGTRERIGGLEMDLSGLK